MTERMWLLPPSSKTSKTIDQCYDPTRVFSHAKSFGRSQLYNYWVNAFISRADDVVFEFYQLKRNTLINGYLYDSFPFILFFSIMQF